MKTSKNGMPSVSKSNRLVVLGQTKDSPVYFSISLKPRAQKYFGFRAFAGDQDAISKFARFRHLSTIRRQKLSLALSTNSSIIREDRSWSTHDLSVFQAALVVGEKSLALELATQIYNELLRCVSELEDDGSSAG